VKREHRLSGPSIPKGVVISQLANGIPEIKAILEAARSENAEKAGPDIFPDIVPRIMSLVEEVLNKVTFLRERCLPAQVEFTNEFK
jgi:hypothetical protein